MQLVIDEIGPGAATPLQAVRLLAVYLSGGAGGKESAIRKLNELLADDAVGSNPILRLVAGTVLMHERDYAGALKHTNSGFPYLEGHVEPYMRQLSVSDVVTGPLQAFNGIEKVGHIVHVLRTTGHNGFPVVDEPPFSDSPVLFGLVLRAHLLVLLRKKDFIPNCSASALDASKQFLPHDFAKPGSGKHDRIEEIQFSAEELEMFVDLHPFTNTSPYTVVETMSLAKAHVLFREVGLRHLLVLPKSSKRAPVVGILTRHDFMPEHILGLHPFLFKTRWKKVRLASQHSPTSSSDAR
ncbi:hypothetical protein OsI_17660 [Oryza sativa Indica Group]|uniref:CBS domain-containing protein n=1 Tax=Oryza sativa subsp. indica TaxID=39946 RepID=B8AV87_ORYSI|nr:hypothetical protein OsI_17660 [Oryza sativa Indica Group]